MTNNDIFGAIAKNYGNYENYDLWQHCNAPCWKRSAIFTLVQALKYIIQYECDLFQGLQPI